MASDWADVEDHDFLNEFVGCTISEITTGIDDIEPWLQVHTTRGRTLIIRAEKNQGLADLRIEEP